MVQGPGSKHIGPCSTDLESRIKGRLSKFKLRGSRLLDAEPGLLGLITSTMLCDLRFMGIQD